MNTFKTGVVCAVLIIAVGVCGLLNNIEFLSGVDWFWVGGLAAAGLLLFYISGLNKVTFVLSPFLLLSGFLSIFHQLGMMPNSILLPLLLIAFGFLLLGAFLLRLKMPESLQLADKHEGPDRDGV